MTVGGGTDIPLQSSSEEGRAFVNLTREASETSSVSFGPR